MYWAFKNCGIQAHKGGGSTETFTPFLARDFHTIPRPCASHGAACSRHTRGGGGGWVRRLFSGREQVLPVEGSGSNPWHCTNKDFLTTSVYKTYGGPYPCHWTWIVYPTSTSHADSESNLNCLSDLLYFWAFFCINKYSKSGTQSNSKNGTNTNLMKSHINYNDNQEQHSTLVKSKTNF